MDATESNPSPAEEGAQTSPGEERGGGHAADPGSSPHESERSTDPELAILGVDELLDELLDRVVRTLDVDTAAILLLDEPRTNLVARAAKGLEEEVERGFRLPIGAGFAGRVAATLQPVQIEDLERSDVEVVNPVFREKGVRSLLGVPVAVADRLVGVLHVGTIEPRRFSEEEAKLLRAEGDRAARAIEREQLHEQRAIARTFQRSVLPRELPKTDSAVLGARYLPAAPNSVVGGDWYDAFPLPDGELGLAIGDVVGKGVPAAALMGQLRSALRAYALETSSPGEVVNRLARFLLAEGGMATLVYVTLDPGAGVVRLSIAGHPPPLLIGADGAVRYLEAKSGPPLGARAMRPYAEAEEEIAVGSTLLLYTDGLIERRGERMLDRQSALARAAGEAPSDPDGLCAHVAGTMLPGSPANDDVALLAVLYTGRAMGADLDLTVATRAEDLADVRRAIRHWLEPSGASETEIEATVLAANEACANAVEHAYGPGDATFEVVGDWSGERISVTVRDWGRWRPPRGDYRGRGITLMRAFMDDVEVIPSDSGTTVNLTKKLGVLGP